MADTTMGQRIAEQRKKRNLSQEAFGERMGVSRQAISKWEADGAVPEIDKLIAMSRLFGVSVGWLLGVEEAPEPQTEEAFSEKQLEMLEEIIRRYRQPQPAPPSKVPWVLAALGICAALILGVTALRRVADFPDYSGQLSNLSSNYSYVQGQLLDLSGKLEALAQGERLLSQYEFTGEPLPKLAGVRLFLTATPKQWQPGDRAELSVRKDGVEVQRVACEFNGSTATAQWELPGDDGIYSYCFIRYHADGSQEQQMLDNLTLSAQEPAAALRLDWQGDMSWDWDPKTCRLSFDHVFVFIAPPPLLNYDAEDRWDSIRLDFLVEGEIKKTLDVLDILAQPGNWESEDGGRWLNGGFWPEALWLELPEGSRAEAVLTAEFGGEYTFQRTVSTWTVRDGSIEEGAPEG